MLTSLIVMSIALEALENGKNTHKSRVLLGFRGGFGVFGPWSKVLDGMLAVASGKSRDGTRWFGRGKLAISGKLSILAWDLFLTDYDFAG